MQRLIHFISQCFQLCTRFWLAFFSFYLYKESYQSSSYYSDDKHAKVQVFSLALIFKLWSEKHYRTTSYQQDLLNNLKNVAVPGMGLALSWFCWNKLLALFFVLVCNPCICFLGGMHQALVQVLIQHSSGKEGEKGSIPSYTSGASFSLWQKTYCFFAHNDEVLPAWYIHYKRNLLHPDDWFSLWRMNCRLVAYHSLVTKSEDYKMEDKWTFLTVGKELGVPISPYYDHIEAMVCKNKLIEGGMGIHFYPNAAFGGEWILQEKLKNASWLNALLPHNAPLSTMRIITTSTYALTEECPKTKEQQAVSKSTSNNSMDIIFESGNSLGNGVHHPSTTTTNAIPVGAVTGSAESSSSNSNHTSSSNSNVNTAEDFTVGSAQSSAKFYTSSTGPHPNASLKEAQKYIRAESGLLRLGRMNANTDHSSILFDVNLATGEILQGTTNAHWYQLGVEKAMMTPWLPPSSDIVQHIDYPYPTVAGKKIPNIQEAIDIVVR